MSEAAATALPEWNQYGKHCIGVGFAGLALSALAAVWFPEQFFRSYLVAHQYWLALGLGALVILMLHHLTGGTWGLVLRRIFEAASKTLIPLAVLFIPVLLGVYYLYPWASPENVTNKELKDLLEHKAPYLNVPFFVVRAVIWFAIWIALAYPLNRLSERHEQTNDRKVIRRMRMISAPGLALYGLTITFAAIDWIMSLEPHWFSSIFGVLVAIGQIVPAFAFAVLVLAWLSSRAPVSEVMNRSVWGDLGNLLMAFVLIWAYINFSQFFLIWSADLTEENPWYLYRMEGVWEWVSWSLVLLYFVVPFLMLISSDVKRNPKQMMWVTGLLLAAHYVNQYWLIMASPETLHHGSHSLEGRPFFVHWMDLLTFVGVGGVWLAWFGWCLQARSLLPMNELEQNRPEVQHG